MGVAGDEFYDCRVQQGQCSSPVEFLMYNISSPLGLLGPDPSYGPRYAVHIRKDPRSPNYNTSSMICPSDNYRANESSS